MDFPKIDTRFDNDNRGGVAWRTAVIHDLDGSIGGIRNSYVLIHDGENDSVATDETCKIQPTWNAAVCTGDVGRLFLNKPGGTLARAGLPGRPSPFTAMARTIASRATRAMCAPVPRCG